jgi:transposase-like protein
LKGLGGSWRILLVVAGKSPNKVILTEEQRAELERRSAAYSGPFRNVVRAKATLYAAEGATNQEIAERLDVSRQAVSDWRRRFCQEGLQGLEEKPRSGSPRRFPRRLRGLLRREALDPSPRAHARTHASEPATPGGDGQLVEHEYERKGALCYLAASDVRRASERIAGQRDPACSGLVPTVVAVFLAELVGLAQQTLTDASLPSEETSGLKTRDPKRRHGRNL